MIRVGVVGEGKNEDECLKKMRIHYSSFIPSDDNVPTESGT